MSKTTVIYHSADFDGIFCREIARKFLPEGTEFIGWNFGDPPIDPPLGKVYILDLPCDEPYGIKFPPGKAPLKAEGFDNLVWIDHHKSSIESHPKNIPGYRIDGVAACRLAWQWFTAEARLIEQGSVNREQITSYPFPQKQDYVDRTVTEPLPVRLAGEYDIWDKRDPNADTFQFALRAVASEELPWKLLLSAESGHLLTALIDDGRLIEGYQRRIDEGIAKHRTFDLKWEGLTFLAINAVRCNSKTFEAAVQQRHDGLLGFYTDGAKWTVSLYHAPHRRDLDLSAIAVKHGGGGHKGACGFTCRELPFLKT
jgi:hypothetical protein